MRLSKRQPQCFLEDNVWRQSFRDPQDRSFFSSLYESFLYKPERALELLREGATNDYQNEYGWSALHQACWKGHLDVVKELVNRYPEEIERKTKIGIGFRIS